MSVGSGGGYVCMSVCIRAEVCSYLCEETQAYRGVL